MYSTASGAMASHTTRSRPAARCSAIQRRTGGSWTAPKLGSWPRGWLCGWLCASARRWLDRRCGRRLGRWCGPWLGLWRGRWFRDRDGGAGEAVGDVRGYPAQFGGHLQQVRPQFGRLTLGGLTNGRSLRLRLLFYRGRFPFGGFAYRDSLGRCLLPYLGRVLFGGFAYCRGPGRCFAPYLGRLVGSI